ncbi:MAG: PilZ domain-containing protein [Candidatus Omnitrophica bacterium]|nr:PilZ domain-containing protein [Candidatus Omnitrophota bacterium]
MDERRRFERNGVECPLQIQAVEAAQYMIRNSFCNNVSPVGMSITTFDFYPVNGKVHLNLLSNTLTSMVEAIGRVVWVREMPHQKRFKVGIEFEDPSESLMQKIKALISKKSERQ